MPTTNTAAYVSTGKPSVSGAVYRAPIGTTLPSDATTALGSAFTGLGYCSDDGLTNNRDISDGSIKAWGGDTVLQYMESTDDTFQFTLLESQNVEVLKTVFGANNVTGTLSTGITVSAGVAEVEEYIWVFDMVMRDGYLKRIVVPDACVTTIAEISYTDNEAIGYGVTLKCMSDASGNYHYEYIAKPAATPATP